MKINKLGFIMETPFLKKYHTTYGIDYLRQAGYEVKVFDCSPILNPDAFRYIKADLDDYDENGFVRCLNVVEVRHDIMEFADEHTLFGVSAGYDISAFGIYKSISASKCSFFYFLQDTCYDRSFVTRSQVYFSHLSIKKIKESIFVRLPRKLLGMSFADFVLIGGTANQESYMKFRLCNSKTKIKYVHTRDFDDCIRYKRFNQRLIEEKYCVFLDQYHPYHSDCLKLGFKINANEYYKQLKKIFAFIESNFGVKIIISAHPRSNYDTHPECYDGYTVIKNRTCELAKDAEFLFTHGSNSLSYAFMYQKPYFLIQIDELDKEIFFRKSQAEASEIYRCSIIKASDFSKKTVDNINMALKVDKSWYNEYIHSYLKANYKGTLDTPMFCEELDQYIRERYGE